MQNPVRPRVPPAPCAPPALAAASGFFLFFWIFWPGAFLVGRHGSNRVLRGSVRPVFLRPCEGSPSRGSGAPRVPATTVTGGPSTRGMQTANGVSHPANTFPPNGPSAGAPNGVPASRLEQLQARPQQPASPPNGPAVVQVVSAPAAPRPPMFGGGGGFYLSLPLLFGSRGLLLLSFLLGGRPARLLLLLLLLLLRCRSVNGCREQRTATSGRRRRTALPPPCTAVDPTGAQPFPPF